MHTDVGKATLSRIIVELRQGSDTVTAIDQGYEGGMSKLIVDWQRFIVRMPLQIELSG